MALTADPARRAERTLAAAQASLQAGAFDKALELLGAAESGPLDEFASARVDLLRGQIAFASGLGSDAPPLLLKAAKRLEPLNLDLARETYLSAWMAALFAGRFASAGDLMEVSRAARSLCTVHSPRPVALVLDALTLLVTDGPTAAAPALRRAASVFASAGISVEEGIRWGWLARAAASAVWDDVRWRTCFRGRSSSPVMWARLTSCRSTSAHWAPHAAWTAATSRRPRPWLWRPRRSAQRPGAAARPSPPAARRSAGRPSRGAPLIEATIARGPGSGQGIAVTYAQWAASILYNGPGRHADALAAAQQASQDKPALYIAMWALPELIEAAVARPEQPSLRPMP